MTDPAKNFGRLRSMAKEILARLHDVPALDHAKIFQFQDYHGFSKTRLPDDFLNKVLALCGETKDNMQIEIVGVHADLTNEVHKHENSDAFVVVLGKHENFSEPFNAQTYKNNHWEFVSEGQEIEIPRGTPHGFTVAMNGGNLFFLSIQTPPIVDEHGTDDYIKVLS